MFARAEFVQDEPIVSSHLVSPEATSGVLPLMIPKEMRAMSVAVDEVADMAGFILPYTRVDVLLALQGGGQNLGRSKIILENVPVLAVAQTLERKDQPQPERIVTVRNPSANRAIRVMFFVMPPREAWNHWHLLIPRALGILRESNSSIPETVPPQYPTGTKRPSLLQCKYACDVGHHEYRLFERNV